MSPLGNVFRLQTFDTVTGHHGKYDVRATWGRQRPQKVIGKSHRAALDVVPLVDTLQARWNAERATTDTRPCSANARTCRRLPPTPFSVPG